MSVARQRRAVADGEEQPASCSDQRTAELATTKAIPAAVHVVACTLSLLVLALPLVGCVTYQGSRRPERSFLTTFDHFFRAVGPLLPLLPLAVRACARLAHRPVRGNTQLAGLGGALALWFICQGLRLMMYLVHVSGVAAKRWIDWDEEFGHIMSDHILLGVAVQANLMCEAVVALLTALLWDEWRSWAGRLAFAGHVASFCGAWALGALTAGDMFVTAHYFHPPLQTFAALVIGIPFFWFPALLLTYSYVSERCGLVKPAAL